MEYKAFAYELTKVAAPNAVQRLYAQEKADREFKSLMDSSAPGAAPKAFAKGFATGAALPLVISANMFLANKGNVDKATAVVRQHNVAEALKSMGMKQPEPIAAAFDNMAFKPDGTPRNVLSERLNAARFQLDAEMMEGKLKGSNLPSEAAKKRIGAYNKQLKNLETASMFAPDGAPVKDPKWRVRESQRAVYSPKANLVSPQEVMELERIGRGIASKGKPTVSRVYLQNLARHMKKSLKAPALLGIAAGAFAARGSQAKKKRYADLQRRARRLR